MAKASARATDTRRWHSSWILTALIAVVVAAITAGTGLEMSALVVITALGWILAVALLWIATPSKTHRTGKALASGIMTVLLCVGIWWIVTYDRPRLELAIGGVVTQNFQGDSLGIDLEVLARNVGRQSAYAQKWTLLLIVDGRPIEGRELYGQRLPQLAVNEPELFNQEFPPGKPVRGWLFFGFPELSHKQMEPYFLCKSPLMHRVRFRLSGWDSKNGREWTEARGLTDLANDACQPIPAGPPV